MTQHVNYPEDCSGTDTPVLCIASSLQQRSPDDAVRGTMPVVERPTITLANPAASWVKNWENKPVVGKEIVVREVVAVEESLMYQKQSKHKVGLFSCMLYSAPLARVPIQRAGCARLYVV